MDNGAACVHPSRYAWLQRERECVCVWAHRYVNARAYTRVRAEMHTPLSRVRERFRAYGRGGRIVSPSLCFSLSLSSVLDRGNLRARQGEPDMTSEFESEEVFSRGFDRHALNRRLYLAHLHYYLSREIEESGFLFRGKFCSIKILYIWFCIIWFFL